MQNGLRAFGDHLSLYSDDFIVFRQHCFEHLLISSHLLSFLITADC